MIVIKATLREETRRLSFDSHGFPPYDEIQHKLRAIFSLGSSAHPFWVNVLFFPDDAQPARIKFKQHICDQAEYELAQEPFLRYRGFPSPALVFTVLLSSDVRMNPIHDFHRAIMLQVEVRELESEISILEDDLTRRHQILLSLEEKLDKASYENDTTAANYWTDKVEQKRNGLPELEEKLRGARCRYRANVEELGRVRPTSAGLSFREWSDAEEIDDVSRMAETEAELVAWQFGDGSGNGFNAPPTFPPLDEVLGGAPHSRNPWHAPSHWASNNTSTWAQPAPRASFSRPAPSRNAAGVDQRSFRDLFSGPELTAAPSRNAAGVDQRSFRDLFSGPELTAAPTAREVGFMLDRFLNHFQGQLADTLDGFAQRIAPHPSEELPVRPSASIPDVHIPGAFVQREVAQSSDAQVQTASKDTTKPSSRLGNGGYRHKHITCDGCLAGIRGTRYKCEQCCDYDLCGSCLPFLHTDALHPSSHTFKAMLHPGLEERIKFGGRTSSRAPHQSSHHPATCDICNGVIVGVRFKCLNCPDWDCCSTCSKLIPNVHPDHSFVKLHKPTDYVMNAAWDAKNDVHHPYVVCDGCDMTIRGPRFKCMHPDCPDYDLCVKCESAPVPIHPESHPMLKTKMPLRINSKSSFDPIKSVYEDHSRYRVTRDCKQSSKSRGPAKAGVQSEPTVPVPEPKAATPSTATGFGGSCLSKGMSSKSSSRDEDYDALLKSMFLGVRTSDSTASVKGEVAFSSDGADTPKWVGPFPPMNQSPRSVPSSYNVPALPPNNMEMPSAPAVPAKEAPLVDLDSPITRPAPVPVTFPGCSLPRLRLEFDPSTEVKKTTQTAEAKVKMDPKEEREKNNEVKKPKKVIIHTKEGPTVVTKDEEAPKIEKEKELKPEQERENENENELEKEKEKANVERSGSIMERSDHIATSLATLGTSLAERNRERSDRIAESLTAKIESAFAIGESVCAKPVRQDDHIAPALRRPVTPEAKIVDKSAVDHLDILTDVHHITIPPGTTLPPGTWFTKTWQLDNLVDGSQFDFKYVRLVHKSEGLLGDACKTEVVFHPEDINHNTKISLSLEGLKVPDMPGHQILEHWRFEDEHGNPYGHPLHIQLNVEELQSSGDSTASSSFIVPRAPLEAVGDSFYLPTPPEGHPVPISDELSERVSSIAPSTPGHDDDASSTFSFWDVEVVTHGSAGRTASTDDFTAEDYDFVDETDEETEDGF